MTLEEIADFNEVPIQFVLDIKEEMDKEIQ